MSSANILCVISGDLVQTITELFAFLQTRLVLHAFLLYSITFYSSTFVSHIVPEKVLKCCVPGLNNSQEIRLQVVGGDAM